MNLIITLPRFRSTLTARICFAMGGKLLYDNEMTSVNPGGDFETIHTGHGINTAEFADDEIMKIMIGAFLFESEIGPKDKLIICLRSPGGMSRSQSLVGIWSHDNAVRRMNYWRMMEQLLAYVEKCPNPVFILDTDAMVSDQKPWIDALGKFIGITPDTKAFEILDESKLKPLPDEPEDDAFRTYQKWVAKCYAST